MKHLTDGNLILELKTLVSQEIRITTLILEYLQEVEFRKVYLQMGYPSLFEFCLKELRYSEGASQRRISAMRLLKELPEVEAKIISGALSLTVVSQAQSFFRKQAKKAKTYSKVEKLKLLKSIENSSKRDCEILLLKLAPEEANVDRLRAISEQLTEIRLTVEPDFLKKLDTIRNLLSHAKPNVTNKEILDYSMEFFLEKKDPMRSYPHSLPPVAVKQTRHISVHMKRAVWKKSNGQCCYQDPLTGRRCESKKFLEIDHIQAYSKKGTNKLDNLQLLCSGHNLMKSNKDL